MTLSRSRGGGSYLHAATKGLALPCPALPWGAAGAVHFQPHQAYSLKRPGLHAHTRPSKLLPNGYPLNNKGGSSIGAVAPTPP